jgi:2-amino-4-hydroxy-6-hydroxymethyldihydropteridine diphosphokinase
MAVMILVALGANLSDPAIGTPRDACEWALELMSRRGAAVAGRSRWYRSAPVPASDQPDFINGVVSVATDLAPAELLAMLHGIEADMGRSRGRPNAARVIDLDLLAHGDAVIGWQAARSAVPGTADGLILPHPRLQFRAFVLLPLRDVAPNWRHPVIGDVAETMIAALSDENGPVGRDCSPLP